MGFINLYSWQYDAVKKMKNGCVLCGDTGSGKSRTAIAYYYICQGGDLNDEYPGIKGKIQDLYIITTPKKRDKLEWEMDELAPFMLSTHDDLNQYKNHVYVDSWNNITKYRKVSGAFFIFDEQKVSGTGTWGNTFVRIARNNNWIMLTATPGDKWIDYAQIFIANGYYSNITEFRRDHVVYNRYTKYPQISGYLDKARLTKIRNEVVINMPSKKHTVQHHHNVICEYDMILYKELMRERYDIWKDKPFENANELCYALRKVCNMDESRCEEVLKIVNEKGRVIIFYNFDYELEMLKSVYYGEGVQVAEWNGHKHQNIPACDKWVYLVQYAGAEAWNCIACDTIIFYSQNYSYRITKQAAGRIDRANTPFTDLHYYHLKSNSRIDISIAAILKEKGEFNEELFLQKELEDE